MVFRFKSSSAFLNVCALRALRALRARNANKCLRSSLGEMFGVCHSENEDGRALFFCPLHFFFFGDSNTKEDRGHFFFRSAPDKIRTVIPWRITAKGACRQYERLVVALLRLMREHYSSRPSGGFR